MSTSPRKLEILQEMIGQITGAAKKEFFPAQGIPLGIPKGSIVEVCGPLKTEWMLQFLRENESLQIFWLERDPSVLPTAIQQRGVALDRITFCQVAEPYSALRRAIQSQLFEVIISPSVFEEDRLLKGLQLLTEKSNCVLFLVAKQLKPAWPISVQLEANARYLDGVLTPEIVKHKLAGIS